MRYRFLTADVFTDRRFGGNPLAVLPDATGLDTAAMQTIAREFNLSETVFVLPPDDPARTRKLRIFTPSAELPFAGHPTVGTAIVLAAIGDVKVAQDRASIVFEEGVGPVPVELRADNGRPVFAQLSTPRGPTQEPPAPATAAVAQMLSLTPDDVLDGDWKPEGWGVGNPFLYVTVRDRDALGRARLRTDQWQSVLADYPAQEVYVLTRDPEREGCHVRARMFAPRLGIVEDPATGAGAAALPGYLAGRLAPRDGTGRWVVEQGMEMGRPSILHVEADYRDGAAVAVRVGGAAVLVTEGTLTTDD